MVSNVTWLLSLLSRLFVVGRVLLLLGLELKGFDTELYFYPFEDIFLTKLLCIKIKNLPLSVPDLQRTGLQRNRQAAPAKWEEKATRTVAPTRMCQASLGRYGRCS